MSVPLGYGEKFVLLVLCIVLVQRWFGFVGTIVFVTVIFVTFIQNLRRKNQVWTHLGVPGPPPSLLFGNFVQAQKKNFHNFDMECRKKYGKIFGTYLFTQPDLVVCDADALKQIMVKDFHNFTNRRQISLFSDKAKIFSARLLVRLRDDEWKNIRNTVTPAFTGGKLKNMEHLVNHCIATLLDILETKAITEEYIDARELFAACTLDIIARCAFATDLNCQRNKDDLFLKYAKAANMVNFKSWDILLFMTFPWTLHQLSRFFGITIVRKNIEDFFVNNLVKIIQERRKRPIIDKPDFLQLLINASQEIESQKEKTEIETDEMISHDVGGKNVFLSDDDIVSQTFLFLVAGFDTTSITITNVCYLLALNPDVQETCWEEIGDAFQGQKPTYNGVQNELPYLEAVISETLRLFPPAFRFDRHCSKDYNLNGIKIPKNSAVSIGAYAIHHDEEYYQDPEKFIPERFLPEEKAKRNPFTYLPFGYGPRNCIGMRFAQMEMKLILANALIQFKFIPCDKTEV